VSWSSGKDSALALRHTLVSGRADFEVMVDSDGNVREVRVHRRRRSEPRARGNTACLGPARAKPGPPEVTMHGELSCPAREHEAPLRQDGTPRRRYGRVDIPQGDSEQRRKTSSEKLEAAARDDGACLGRRIEVRRADTGVTLGDLEPPPARRARSIGAAVLPDKKHGIIRHVNGLVVPTEGRARVPQRIQLVYSDIGVSVAACVTRVRVSCAS
jgi:hypothetical protein